HGSSIGLRYIGITGSTRLSGRPQGQAEGAGGGGGEEADEHGRERPQAASPGPELGGGEAGDARRDRGQGLGRSRLAEVKPGDDGDEEADADQAVEDAQRGDDGGGEEGQA